MAMEILSQNIIFAKLTNISQSFVSPLPKPIPMPIPYPYPYLYPFFS
tara:strand:+ start:440 stop:580 length:141 start_codon:yes stop_codon:yes gene_type:complete